MAKRPVRYDANLPRNLTYRKRDRLYSWRNSITRALEDGQAQQTDPMSNSERKIIHRIVSKMEGVTSYSEGEEPNRYVVVDIEG